MVIIIINTFTANFGDIMSFSYSFTYRRTSETCMVGMNENSAIKNNANLYNENAIHKSICSKNVSEKIMNFSAKDDCLSARYQGLIECYQYLIARYQRLIARYKSLIAHHQRFIARYQGFIARYQCLIACYKDVIARYQILIANYEERIANVLHNMLSNKKSIVCCKENTAHHYTIRTNY